jgi:spermidine synthase
MNNILVLGVAGGSVIKTLVDEINFEGKITGVEIDNFVIILANKYFHLDQIQNLEIIIDDAFEFVLKAKDNYDLIIIDIFQDTKMPNFLFETFFISRICDLLQPKGFILFNTMVVNENQKKLNLDFLNAFNAAQYTVTNFFKVEELNELIIVECKF